jgi:hypothetical protein
VYGCTYISTTLGLLGLASGDVIILGMVTRVGSNVNQGMSY